MIPDYAIRFSYSRELYSDMYGLIPAPWSRGLKRCALNLSYRMQRWFDPRWGINLRTVMGSVSIKHHVEFGKTVIFRGNTGMGSQQRLGNSTC